MKSSLRFLELKLGDKNSDLVPREAKPLGSFLPESNLRRRAVAVLLTVWGSCCWFGGLRVHLWPLYPSPLQSFWTVEKLLSFGKTLINHLPSGGEKAQVRQGKGVMGPLSGLGLTDISESAVDPRLTTVMPPGPMPPVSSAAPACPQPLSYLTGPVVPTQAPRTHVG